MSGYVGYAFRAAPIFNLPGAAFRWGVGAGFPSRGAFRITTELDGIANSSSTASYTAGTFPVSIDGTVPPLTVNTQNLARLTLGATYQAPKGFFVGVGGSWNFSTLERLAARAENGEIPAGDYWDWQVRIGYHPGVRKYVPPPPPPTPTPAPTPPGTYLVRSKLPGRSDVSRRIGRTSTVTAIPMSSINCAVTYRAGPASTGTFANRQLARPCLPPRTRKAPSR